MKSSSRKRNIHNRVENFSLADIHLTFLTTNSFHAACASLNVDRQTLKKKISDFFYKENKLNYQLLKSITIPDATAYWSEYKLPIPRKSRQKDTTLYMPFVKVYRTIRETTSFADAAAACVADRDAFEKNLKNVGISYLELKLLNEEDFAKITNAELREIPFHQIKDIDLKEVTLSNILLNKFHEEISSQDNPETHLIHSCTKIYSYKRYISKYLQTLTYNNLPLTEEILFGPNFNTTQVRRISAETSVCTEVNSPSTQQANNIEVKLMEESLESTSDKENADENNSLTATKKERNFFLKLPFHEVYQHVRASSSLTNAASLCNNMRQRGLKRNLNKSGTDYLELKLLKEEHVTKFIDNQVISQPFFQIKGIDLTIITLLTLRQIKFNLCNYFNSNADYEIYIVNYLKKFSYDTSPLTKEIVLQPNFDINLITRKSDGKKPTIPDPLILDAIFPTLTKSIIQQETVAVIDQSNNSAALNVDQQIHTLQNQPCSFIDQNTPFEQIPTVIEENSSIPEPGTNNQGADQYHLDNGMHETIEAIDESDNWAALNVTQNINTLQNQTCSTIDLYTLPYQIPIVIEENSSNFESETNEQEADQPPSDNEMHADIIKMIKKYIPDLNDAGLASASMQMLTCLYDIKLKAVPFTKAPNVNLTNTGRTLQNNQEKRTGFSFGSVNSFFSRSGEKNNSQPTRDSQQKKLGAANFTTLNRN